MCCRGDRCRAPGDAADRPRSISRRAGEPLTRRACASLRAGPGVILLSGRFEGVDERVIEARSSRKSRSATMCCPAARSRHGAARCGGAPAARRHGQRSPSPRRASPRACWNIRITPGRRYGRAAPSPRCCCPATTRESPNGAASRPRALTKERRPDLWLKRPKRNRADGVQPRLRVRAQRLDALDQSGHGRGYGIA